ncbi:hypothetical protein [Streptomyces sp. NBC_00091]|uniref:hypothetical protein n=1 Tax=Streptomyces sp. NBC_00091 TaxID=2975648 RepID=UPI002257EC8C|nr:hypothetical protein [Streptomyces sp. NBC_00091]MCX5380807.1 hypothetical protein [Streptomyces sp. NBC_00091]
MVTARSPRTPRARSSAGLLHLLGLTLLLLGLVCAHGAGSHDSGSHDSGSHSPGSLSGSHGSASHGSASWSAAAIATPASAALVDRHDPSHPGHDCAHLPPRTGTAVDAPPAPPATALGHPVRTGHGDTAGHGSGACPAGAAAAPQARTSTVLQV